MGCGRGELVELLTKHGWTAHGIDSYHGFEADGKRYFKTSLDQYDPEQQYELISMVHSFEHMSDPLDALNRVGSLLRPDGVVLVVVPNFGGIWSQLLGCRWHMLRPDDEAFHYSPEGLCKVMERCGFRCKHLRTFSGYAPSPWQIQLIESSFYETGAGRFPMLGSLVSRTNLLLQPLLNRVVDLQKRGAEIQLVAFKP